MKLNKLYLALSLLEIEFARSQFTFRLDEDQCQKCCKTAADQFSDVTFSLTTCEEEGCVRNVGANQKCQDLFGNNVNNEDRKGCELGRDFLTAGITSLLDVDQVLRCDFAANIIPFEVVVPPANLFVRSEIDCRDCCSDINDALDSGNGNNPDDFAEATCRNSCSNQRTCFEEASYRERTGCLTGLDLRVFGLTTLEIGIITCDSNGNFAISAPTEFPTASPTNRPTGAPTFEEDQDNNNFNMTIVIGFAGVSILVLLIGAAFFMGKRKAKHEYRTKISELEDMYSQSKAPAPVPEQRRDPRADIRLTNNRDPSVRSLSTQIPNQGTPPSFISSKPRYHMNTTQSMEETNEEDWSAAAVHHYYLGESLAPPPPRKVLRESLSAAELAKKTRPFPANINYTNPRSRNRESESSWSDEGDPTQYTL